MDISSIKKEVEQLNEPIRSPSEQNEGEPQSAIQENVQLTEPTNFLSEHTEIEDQPTNGEFAQLTDPSYWLSYEYQQINAEVKKLNEKMNLIISIIQKKPRKNTITEVNSKVDSIIEKLNKKKANKRKFEFGDSSTANSGREWLAQISG